MVYEKDVDKCKIGQMDRKTNCWKTDKWMAYRQMTQLTDRCAVILTDSYTLINNKWIILHWRKRRAVWMDKQAAKYEGKLTAGQTSS
jgi:hypothetical protein